MSLVSTSVSLWLICPLGGYAILLKRRWPWSQVGHSARFPRRNPFVIGWLDQRIGVGCLSLAQGGWHHKGALFQDFTIEEPNLLNDETKINASNILKYPHWFSLADLWYPWGDTKFALTNLTSKRWGATCAQGTPTPVVERNQSNSCQIKQRPWWPLRSRFASVACVWGHTQTWTPCSELDAYMSVLWNMYKLGLSYYLVAVGKQVSRCYVWDRPFTNHHLHSLLLVIGKTQCINIMSRLQISGICLRRQLHPRCWKVLEGRARVNILCCNMFYVIPRHWDWHRYLHSPLFNQPNNENMPVPLVVSGLYGGVWDNYKPYALTPEP